MGANGRSGVVLIAIAALVVALVVVAIVVALQPPPMFDPTTPEATAQGYFQALHDRDDAAITSYFTADLNDRCDTAPYLDDFRDHDERDATGVSIMATEVEGARANVDVAITVTYGDAPFDADSNTFEETLVMEHEGERWLISEPPWPLDIHSCERKG